MFKSDATVKEALASVKKALQSRGGAKAQARNLGMIIFRTATDLYVANKHKNWMADDQWAGGQDENNVNQDNIHTEAKRKSPQQPLGETAANKRPCRGGASAGSSSVVATGMDETWPQGVQYKLSSALPEAASIHVRDQPSASGNEISKAGMGSQLVALGERERETDQEEKSADDRIVTNRSPSSPYLSSSFTTHVHRAQR